MVAKKYTAHGVRVGWHGAEECVGKWPKNDVEVAALPAGLIPLEEGQPGELIPEHERRDLIPVLPEDAAAQSQPHHSHSTVTAQSQHSHSSDGT